MYRTTYRRKLEYVLLHRSTLIMTFVATTYQHGPQHFFDLSRSWQRDYRLAGLDNNDLHRLEH